MRRKRVLAIVAGVVVLLLALALFLDRSGYSSASEDEGRAFSDAFASDLIHDNYAGFYSKMNSGYQHDVKLQAVPDTLSQMYASYSGKPLEAQYKMDTAGMQFNLLQLPYKFHRYWYALRTERAPEGTWFLAVQVVRENGKPVCDKFGILRFSDGNPPPAGLQ